MAHAGRDAAVGLAQGAMAAVAQAERRCNRLVRKLAEAPAGPDRDVEQAAERAARGLSALADAAANVASGIESDLRAAGCPVD